MDAGIIDLSLKNVPVVGKVKADGFELRSGANKDRLEAKKGLNDGFGVDVTLKVSISGPESLRSSSSSIKSSISPASISRSAPV
jgi:hypothetical protein